MTKLSLYVGTYNAYNNGSLFGEWVDLDRFQNLSEFYTYIRELHKDEEDPEFMFQDYECSGIIQKMDLIGESYIAENIYEVMQELADCEYSEEILESFLDFFGEVNSVAELIEKVEDTYAGSFDSDAEFAQDLVEQTGELPELPCYIHIDWESTARDLMTDYSESGGNYFRCI